MWLVGRSETYSVLGLISYQRYDGNVRLQISRLRSHSGMV